MPADLHESTIPGLLIAELDEFGEQHTFEAHVFTRDGSQWRLLSSPAAPPPRKPRSRLLAWLRRLFKRGGASDASAAEIAALERVDRALTENAGQYLRDARDAFRA